ncbi:MAG: pyruvate dehydrogenase component [Actinomycetota bacterium]|jgi:pyruvate dehydrogenase E1 component
MNDLRALRAVEQRVLWLATRIIDAANHDRPNTEGIKVGGHQASSASMVSIMTALWFHHLRAQDRVSVKPHASPVLHAINYLLGRLDRRYLTELRSFGGLQAYPSRTKDPDPVDFSTGSVGLGATAPLFAAAAHRYLDLHYWEPTMPSARLRRDEARFVALMGDAELDEGNVWEAILEPAVTELGGVLWVVDLNRQSLDRVVPGMKVKSLEGAFQDAGWQVLEVKYGSALRAAFDSPKGEGLRRRIDEMPNDEYQALFGLAPEELRAAVCLDDDDVRVALEPYVDGELRGLIGDLGGHDLEALLDAYAAADACPTQPTVVFAYTMKGWGLPFAGDPFNHAAIMSAPQVDELRTASDLTAATEWDRFDADSDAGRLCSDTAERLRRPDEQRPTARISVPSHALGAIGSRPTSTQEAFGRVLSSLARTEAGDRIVTLAPDVSISTNLGGWINKVGVFAPDHHPDLGGERSVLRWEQSPKGQHIELGISEMNLFSMLAQLGLTRDLWGEPLLPVGTVYDPFVCRGLDALIYALYNGARFVIAGTPSGVTLAPEGGAHQSTITASIGLELPGITFAEPAYAQPLDWTLCDGLAQIGDPDGGADSLYLRLSTRPIDQAPFAAAVARMGEERIRADVLAGGYRLLDPPAADGEMRVTIAASGPVLPEVFEAAHHLAEEGVAATVVDVTSLDRLFRGWAAATRSPIRDVRAARSRPHVASLLSPGEPIVTVHDAASHAMAWLGSVHGAPVVPLGVDEFGQSGTITDLYRRFDLVPDAIANAALIATGC